MTKPKEPLHPEPPHGTVQKRRKPTLELLILRLSKLVRRSNRGTATWLTRNRPVPLYAPEGRLKYVYNFLGLETYAVEATGSLSPGNHEIRMEFAYDGGGLGRGGSVTLFADGQKVAEGRVEQTVPVYFSVDATAMVGDKHGSPIASDMSVAGNRFNGKVAWVRLDVGEQGEEQRVSPEHLLRVALGTQ